MKYVLTETAKGDIRHIIRQIRLVQKSPQNAQLVASRLRATFQKLVRLPRLGQPRSELKDNTARVIPVTGVLIIYDPTLKPLTILRVIHAARDLRQIDPRE
jgi:antitoxin ParD1/3/4/toxin ParE1/3/4